MKIGKLKIIAILLVAFFMNACGEAQNGETASVGLSMGSYTTAKTTQQPWWLELVAPKVHAAIAADSLKFCFKRLRIKPAESATDSDQPGFDPATDEDNVDFNLGEVVIDPSGTSLGNITVPIGLYRRIEFDLESDCASGNSLSLTNDNGSFSSQERITIKFEGDFVVEEGSSINLPMDQIVSSLNSFNPSNPGDQQTVSQELKDAAEVISSNP